MVITNPTNRRYEHLAGEDTNPCLKEQKLTYKCLADNNYDPNICSMYFENYRGCKTFWNRIRMYRMRKGIEPHLPTPAERDEIKAQFANTRFAS